MNAICEFELNVSLVEKKIIGIHKRIGRIDDLGIDLEMSSMVAVVDFEASCTSTENNYIFLSFKGYVRICRMTGE